MAPERYDLPIELVDTPEGLAAALPQWFNAHLLALDIECSLTGVHHCALALLQVASDDRAWILDPLALKGLMGPAVRALAEIPWIVHDFSGDGVVFKRIFDVVPSSVLDTLLLARALDYPQPSLKTLAKLKLGIDIPKDEQDSNWMYRPLRPSQIRYAARDAALLFPLLRVLAAEAEANRNHPTLGPRLARLPEELQDLLRRIRAYRAPTHFPVEIKAKALGLPPSALQKARRLSELRLAWGNEGDVAAVMEMGNRWILARLLHPPRTKEALARTIPNPRFRAKRLDALWEILRPD